MTEMLVSSLLALPLEEIRARLPGFLASYVTTSGPTRAEIIEGVSEVRRSSDLVEWEALLARMHELGADFGFYEANPLAARIAVAFMEPLVAATSSLQGLEHLDASLAELRAGRRIMIVGNHLSYADTMAMGQLLVRSGRAEVRALITAVAGPKVYSEPMRRLAAAGLHSIKVAQSSRVATGQPELSPREIVRIARASLVRAEQAMDEGRLVLIYPEGTRSRSGRLQPFLKATNRWLSLDDVVLLPFTVCGSEKLYSLEDDLMLPAECRGRFGPLIDTRALDGDRNRILEAAHDALAAILPEDYRPEPGASKAI